MTTYVLAYFILLLRQCDPNLIITQPQDTYVLASCAIWCAVGLGFALWHDSLHVLYLQRV